MKKGIFCIIICMLMIVSTIIPVSAIPLSEKTSQFLLTGNTFYVGGSGPNNYTKIQDAINDAINGDTVYVYDDSSPYYENIIIEKSIRLTGENRETTLLLGDESSDWVIVNISASDVSISGFTIQPNMGQPAGIVAIKEYTYPDYWNIVILQNISIHDNIIRNTGYGVFGIRLKYGHIYDNIIENCKASGILLFISSNITIANNIVSGCSYRGIQIDGLWEPYRIMNYRNPVPENNIITENTICSNRWGIRVDGGSMNTKITKNNITENHEIGILLSQASKTEIAQNNFIGNTQNAFFNAICILRYPRFMQNTWDNNYWGEQTNSFIRIDGRVVFMLIPRIPIGISFPNFSLTEFELPWMIFDKNPAQEPYDI